MFEIDLVLVCAWSFLVVLLPQSCRQAKDHFGSYIDLSDRLFSLSPIYLSRVNPGLSADVNKKNPRGFIFFVV